MVKTGKVLQGRPLDCVNKAKKKGCIYQALLNLNYFLFYQIT